mgnify:CR=1 FL=1
MQTICFFILYLNVFLIFLKGDGMKKIIVGMILAGGLVYGASIDTSKAEVKWTAFKTPAKIGVNGKFDDVQFKFGTPNKTQSLESQLNNATATIDVNKINTADKDRDDTIRTHFFGHFQKKEPIKVTFKEVIEGKNKGTLLANVRMNGKTNKVPMQFEVTSDKNKKLIVKGVIDIGAFGAENARASLQAAVADLHEGLTWSQVEIALEAPLK